MNDEDTVEYTNSDPEKLMKFRLEECENGWICHETKGKDNFAGRKVFRSTLALCNYLMRTFPDKPKQN